MLHKGPLLPVIFCWQTVVKFEHEKRARMSKPKVGLGAGAGGGAMALTQGAAAAAAQRQRTLLQRADTEITSMLDNFSHLMKASRVAVDSVRTAQEVFQMEVHSSRVVQAADVLLKLVSELKQTAVFSDFLALNTHVAQRVTKFSEDSQEADRLLAAIAEQAAESLRELELHYFRSSVRSLEFAAEQLIRM